MQLYAYPPCTREALTVRSPCIQGRVSPTHHNQRKPEHSNESLRPFPSQYLLLSLHPRGEMTPRKLQGWWHHLGWPAGVLLRQKMTTCPETRNHVVWGYFHIEEEVSRRFPGVRGKSQRAWMCIWMDLKGKTSV